MNFCNGCEIGVIDKRLTLPRGRPVKALDAQGIVTGGQRLEEVKVDAVLTVIVAADHGEQGVIAIETPTVVARLVAAGRQEAIPVGQAGDSDE